MIRIWQRETPPRSRRSAVAKQPARRAGIVEQAASDAPLATERGYRGGRRSEGALAGATAAARHPRACAIRSSRNSPSAPPAFRSLAHIRAKLLIKPEARAVEVPPAPMTLPSPPSSRSRLRPVRSPNALRRCRTARSWPMQGYRHPRFASFRHWPRSLERLCRSWPDGLPAGASIRRLRVAFPRRPCCFSSLRPRRRASWRARWSPLQPLPRMSQSKFRSCVCLPGAARPCHREHRRATPSVQTSTIRDTQVHSTDCASR